MAFSKEDMQKQLFLFMEGFGESVDRMLGTNLREEMENLERVKDTTLWWVSEVFYDYGICGIPHKSFGRDLTIDAEFADVELFLKYIEALDPYLCESTSYLPYKAKYAAQTAIARHVLESGHRYALDVDDETYCLSGYLGIADIARLADMDVKSVRNAANPKKADPLHTETDGKHTLVSIEEARRWLAGRKGFVPTKTTSETVIASPEMTSIELPASTVEHLYAKAKAAGMSIQDYLQQHLG